MKTILAPVLFSLHLLGCESGAVDRSGNVTSQLDHQIERHANYDISLETKNARQLFDVPCLDIVPSGETLSRDRVFDALSLNESQLTDFRYTYRDNVIFLTWRVSPSYFISCMTGWDGLDETDDDLMYRFSQCRPDLHPDLASTLLDRTRRIYGIRLLAAPLGPGSRTSD